MPSPELDSPVRRSLAIYLGLMAYLALVKVVLALADVKSVVAGQDELFTWPLIGFLALTGTLSVWLAPRVGLPALWDARVSTRSRLLVPAAIGLGFGTLTLTLQATTDLHHALTHAAHVPAINVAFPGSILFYSGGAIILESAYRLILFTLPLWLISSVLLRERGRTAVFWIVAALTSALEPREQMIMLGGNAALAVTMGVTTYGTNLLEAYLLRRNGWLAPLTFRLALYSVLHVLGSVLGF